MQRVRSSRRRRHGAAPHPDQPARRAGQRASSRTPDCRMLRPGTRRVGRSGAIRHDRLARAAARLFRLDTTRSTRRPGSYGARPNWVFLDSQRMRLPSWWRVRPPDSLEVIWSTGFAGVQLAFRVRGDSLVGRALAFADVRRQLQPSATVVATRRSCPEWLAD